MTLHFSNKNVIEIDISEYLSVQFTRDDYCKLVNDWFYSNYSNIIKLPKNSDDVIDKYYYLMNKRRKNNMWSMTYYYSMENFVEQIIVEVMFYVKGESRYKIRNKISIGCTEFDKIDVVMCDLLKDTIEKYIKNYNKMNPYYSRMIGRMLNE
jgi:hypothetical protein